MYNFVKLLANLSMTLQKYQLFKIMKMEKLFSCTFSSIKVQKPFLLPDLLRNKNLLNVCFLSGSFQKYSNYIIIFSFLLN